MLKYSNLGVGKQLNQIVMAGSHDAGVAEGGGNTEDDWQHTPQGSTP